MKQEAMKEALNRRKGMGLDLTIIVGKPQDSQENNPDNMELAPDVKDDSANPSMQQVDDKNMDVLNNQNSLLNSDESQDKELARKMLDGTKEEDDEDTSTLSGKVRALMRSKMKKG